MRKNMNKITALMLLLCFGLSTSIVAKGYESKDDHRFQSASQSISLIEVLDKKPAEPTWLNTKDGDDDFECPPGATFFECECYKNPGPICEFLDPK
jgi:hypothetical protein